MNWKLTIGKLRDAWGGYREDREALASFPAGRPIFLTGTHRSGTTWVGSMLAEPGLWYLHEPFNPNKRVWKESFTYAAPGTKRPEIDRYVNGMLKGSHRATALYRRTDHWMMPLRLIRPCIQRVLIKDPLACLLTGYLSKSFNFETRVLFRHPAGFVSSVTRLGWPTGGFLKQFLDRPSLMSDHLSRYQDLMEQYKDRDDIGSATVLCGILNAVLWNQVGLDANLRWHRFEDLCADPIGQFRTIFGELSLPYTEATEQRHLTLCFGPGKSPADYHTHAVARNSRAMAESWKKQLTLQQVTEIRSLWDVFDIDLYRSDADWALEKLEAGPGDAS